MVNSHFKKKKPNLLGSELKKYSIEKNEIFNYVIKKIKPGGEIVKIGLQQEEIQIYKDDANNVLLNINLELFEKNITQKISVLLNRTEYSPLYSMGSFIENSNEILNFNCKYQKKIILEISNYGIKNNSTIKQKSKVYDHYSIPFIIKNLLFTEGKSYFVFLFSPILKSVVKAEIKLIGNEVTSLNNRHIDCKRVLLLITQPVRQEMYFLYTVNEPSILIKQITANYFLDIEDNYLSI